MKLELDSRLRVFAALARQHSFSRAAEELLISQPAVSRHIADLERDLGVMLVNRKTGDISLTPAGEYLAQYVLRAEGLLSQASQGLKAYTQVTPATLQLAASGTPGNYLLPPVLAIFAQSYPNVTVRLFMSTSSLVIDAVRTHRAELGVVGGLAASEEVEVEPVYEDEIVLIGPAEAGEKPFSLGDLRTCTWLTREPGSSTRQVVEAAWQDLGILPRQVVELPSWEAIKLAVSSGAGIAACSRLAVDTELKAKSLALLDVPGWKVRRTISLVRIAGLELSQPAAWFREKLLSQFTAIR